MVLHPEEWRVARVLQALIAQSGVPPEVLERRLGREPGWLAACLEGRRRFGFADVFELLPLLGTPPTDFLVSLYVSEASQTSAGPAVRDSKAQRASDRRFDRSLRAVRNAVARRSAWNRGRTGDDT